MAPSPECFSPAALRHESEAGSLPVALKFQPRGPRVGMTGYQASKALEALSQPPSVAAPLFTTLNLDITAILIR